MKINLPTQLTLLRLALIPFFIIFILQDGFIARLIAGLVFGVAGLTDYFDGRLAREMKMETTLGKFLDPLADKMLISTVLVLFVQIPEIRVPAWMVVIIIGREFFITGLRTLAASKNRILPASKAGKFKTTSQIVTISVIIIILWVNAALAQYWGIPKGDLIGRPGWQGMAGWFLYHGPFYLIALATLFTFVSGYLYLQDNIDLFDDKQKSPG